MAMRPYLPSSQFSLLAGSLLLSIGLVYAASRINDFRTAPGSVIALNPTNGKAPAGDTDYDGLPDWEEIIYGTDPEVADTDGDGTPDGVEVKTSQDPSIPGAGFSQTKSPADLEELLVGVRTGNATESIGRNILVSLAAAAGEGDSTDEPTQNRIVERALQELSVENPPAYGISDIVVVPETVLSLRAYGNAVMTAMGKHISANWGDALLAVGLAVDGIDESRLPNLKVISAEYRALARDLATLSVPAGLVSLHVRMQNGFVASASASADMELVLDDPLRGFAAVEKFRTAVSENAKVFTSIAEKLKKDGILFDESEPGKAWDLFRSTP